MIHLLLAIVSSMLVSVVMRLSEGRAKNSISMLAMNYLMCMLVSAAYTGLPLFPREEGLGAALGLGAICGVLFLAAFMLLQWNVRVNGVVLPSTFMKLGVLVPTVLAIVLFGEKPELAQVLGFVCALAAILLIQFDKGQSRAKSGVRLLVLMLGGGMADSMAKFYEAWGSAALESHYLLYTFAVALILCALLAWRKGQGLSLRDVGFGLLLGAPNYLSARFLLRALSSLPAVVVYPTFSVGTIILVTLVGRVLFGEKLSRRQLLAMGVILLALVLLNL